jgi:hypothetical protein
MGTFFYSVVSLTIQQAHLGEYHKHEEGEEVDEMFFKSQKTFASLCMKRFTLIH